MACGSQTEGKLPADTPGCHLPAGLLPWRTNTPTDSHTNPRRYQDSGLLAYVRYQDKISSTSARRRKNTVFVEDALAATQIRRLEEKDRSNTGLV